MTEVLIILGALLGFCLLTFGAAWLMAAWMGGRRSFWRRKRPGRR